MQGITPFDTKTTQIGQVLTIPMVNYVRFLENLLCGVQNIVCLDKKEVKREAGKLVEQLKTDKSNTQLIRKLVERNNKLANLRHNRMVLNMTCRIIATDCQGRIYKAVTQERLDNAVEILRKYNALSEQFVPLQLSAEELVIPENFTPEPEPEVMCGTINQLIELLRGRH